MVVHEECFDEIRKLEVHQTFQKVLADCAFRWVNRLQDEFFHQGDLEKSAGLPVSPLFDRDKPGVTSSQPGFFDIIALPLFSVSLGHLADSILIFAC